MTEFAHLHVHSEYSMLDGLSNLGDLARHAAELGQRHLALTDHGNMFGSVRFSAACTKAGIHPILGCEVYTSIRDRVDEDREAKDQSSNHLTLLVMNDVGHRNMNLMITEANGNGFHRRPKVSLEHLASHSEGIICLSGCLAGAIPRMIMAERHEDAMLRAKAFKDIFGDRFYLEVHDHGIEEQIRVQYHLEEIGNALSIPIVVANDSHYTRADEAGLHELLLAIQTKAHWNDAKRMQFSGDPAYYLKSGAEMQSLFPYNPEWLAESVRIAERCTFKLNMEKQLFPRPANVKDGEDENARLRELSVQGLREKGIDLDQATQDRLSYEIGVIIETGYVRYFLIVADVCRWARENEIRSSARGSVAGSLVAYALGIAPVNPLKYSLSFERFLNPGRTPDIDLDFADDRRSDVMNYVARAYGEKSVSQIVTFSQLHGRSAVRDVARVFGIDQETVSSITEAIPLGSTIAKAVESDEGLAEKLKKTPWLRNAQRLEGTIRHASTHAAGIVIAGFPLTDKVALVRNTNGLPAVGLEMGDAEKVGLIKFDFLGLKTLALVERTVQMVMETTGDEIDTEALEDGDAKTYALLGRGDTVGVFQLESAGMRKYLIDLKPETIHHLQAMVALYRPGPLAEIPRYINRRRGIEPVTYPHPIFEPILRETYGVFVYQEAIMEMAQQIMGLSAYESDQFLYAIRKKHPERLLQYQPVFAEACKKKGVPDETITAVWNALLPFGDYGFNKAHAACYGQLAYITAYLKAHYPLAFYAALLDMERGNKERTSIVLADARRNGIAIHTPSINKSGLGFTLDGAVLFGLSGVKYLGDGAAKAIVSERRKGPFTSLQDFRDRIPKKVVTDRGLRNLICAHAFREFGSVLLHLAWSGDRNKYGKQDILDLERDVLGVVISDPHAALSRLDKAGRTHLIGEVMARHEDGLDDDAVVLGGRIVELKKAFTKKGKPMIHMTLEDETGLVRGVGFGEVAPDGIKVDSIVIVHGKMREYMEQLSLVIEKVRGVFAAPVDKD